MSFQGEGLNKGSGKRPLLCILQKALVVADAPAQRISVQLERGPSKADGHRPFSDSMLVFCGLGLRSGAYCWATMGGLVFIVCDACLARNSTYSFNQGPNSEQPLLGRVIGTLIFGYYQSLTIPKMPSPPQHDP